MAICVSCATPNKSALECVSKHVGRERRREKTHDVVARTVFVADSQRGGYFGLILMLCLSDLVQVRTRRHRMRAPVDANLAEVLRMLAQVVDRRIAHEARRWAPTTTTDDRDVKVVVSGKRFSPATGSSKNRCCCS